MAADHFCLRWNNYQSNMVSELDMLRTEEYLVDVTLCCEGHKFRAHKVILSACSPYFRNVFKENPCEHPVVILKDVFPEDVEALLSFVYQGIVYVSEKKLSSFLQTAELLQIKGLTGAASSFNDEQARQAATPQSPVKRRKSAPVRIVKQEDGEDTNSTQMEGEEEGIVKNEFSEDIIEDTKNQDDDGSIGEESESEGSGDVNATTYASIDMREEVAAADRERLGSAGIKNEPVSNFMQQSLAARQRAAVSSQGVMDSTIQNKMKKVTIQVTPPVCRISPHASCEVSINYQSLIKDFQNFFHLQWLGQSVLGKRKRIMELTALIAMEGDLAHFALKSYQTSQIY
ncbi:uncharacterized protein isoform X4 [Rhodnius prolixus]|uniref:uncharacterized protein isoform X4 n=1 Tax=Rhodnius prolixus TaxID=13249 RepID=UPI003D189759